MANPFAVQPVNILQALMMGEQGFDSGQKRTRETSLASARQEAATALQEGGDMRSVLARLISGGAVQEANALSNFHQANMGANSVYGTPIYGTTPDGKTAIGTFDKSGQFRQVNTGGFSPTPGVKTVDTGTGTAIIDSKTGAPAGQTAIPRTSTGQQAAPGYIPKDVRGEAAQKKEGTELGEAKATLASVRSKLPGLRAVVGELGKLGDKATYTVAGQVLDKVRTEVGASPRDAAIARTKYIAMVDNQVLPMLRDTFGAAFTVKEGESLRATLGDPNKTPLEKRAVLQAFIEQKIRNIEALEVQTGGAPQGGPAQGATKTIGGRTFFQQNGQWYEQ